MDKRPALMGDRRCPHCQLKWTLSAEYDGLIKCLHCLNMWLPEEFPSELELLMKHYKEAQ